MESNLKRAEPKEGRCPEGQSPKKTSGRFPTGVAALVYPAVYESGRLGAVPVLRFGDYLPCRPATLPRDHRD